MIITLLALYLLFAILAATIMFLLHITGALDFLPMVTADAIVFAVFIVLFIIAVVIGYKRGKK